MTITPAMPLNYDFEPVVDQTAQIAVASRFSIISLSGSCQARVEDACSYIFSKSSTQLNANLFLKNGPTFAGQ